VPIRTGSRRFPLEGTARISWQNDGVRDGFAISFGGGSVFNYPPDVAAAFVQASRKWQAGCPFPEDLEDDSIAGARRTAPPTPLADSVRETIEPFRR
jgi:hypothetical protein